MELTNKFLKIYKNTVYTFCKLIIISLIQFTRLVRIISMLKYNTLQTEMCFI